MKGYVDGIDWLNCPAMKYWSFPKSYAKDSKAEIKNYIFSGDYIGALKVDGYYQRLVKDEDGNCFMIARSKNVKGEPVDKYEWVPQLHSFMESLPNGTVLLSECYLPGDEGSKKITTLLGCLKDKCIARQKAGKELHFYVFDVCAWAGKNVITETIAARVCAYLDHIRFSYPHPYVTYAKYLEGEQLWFALEKYLLEDREGMVILRKDCPIYFKRTPARMSIKIKKEINETIDCFFTGKTTMPTKEYTGKEITTWPYWINEKTGEKFNECKFKEFYDGSPLRPITKPYFNGWAGSLEIGVMKDGEIYPIGYLSGITDEIKANPDKYKMQPIEVTAMEILDSGALRHAKFVGFRPDLTLEDCVYEKVFGGK